MSTDIVTKPEISEEEQAIISKKRTAWAGLGEDIYHKEMGLQAKAQSFIVAITIPTKIEEVPAAEAQLKEIKKAQSTISEERKEITRKFDAVISRLSDPENSLSLPIKNLSECIIRIKQEHERLEKLKVAKADELKRIKEEIKNHLAQIDLDFRNRITKQCASAYEYALTTADVKPAEIEEWINTKFLPKLGAASFTADVPPLFPKHHDLNEIEQIITETWFCNPHAYVTMYEKELRAKFVDYSVAYQNKVAALEASAREAELAQQKQQAEKDSALLANKLESSSTMLVQSAPMVKALKKSYEVEMVENAENAIKILSAFVANMNLCMPKVRLTKWFSFTPAQAAKALSAVKCDDNLFQPSGIIFKEVDKL